MANCAARWIAGAAFSSPGTALVATTPNAPSVIASPRFTGVVFVGVVVVVGFLTTVVESSSIFNDSSFPGVPVDFAFAFGDGVFDDRDLPSFFENTLMVEVGASSSDRASACVAKSE